MDRLRKNELLMMVNRLLQVNEEKAFDLETLTDCQNSAIDLGNYLEAAYTDTEPAVSILEAYCESLFRISQAESGQPLTGLCALVKEQLSSLEKYIQNDLPADRKEVIFLPYKACMWDSLESVWMAARDDEDCDAYVIPIPYFEKNRDGSLGEMHYEGGLYPEYVPITSWQEYDIEARRPDAIYIHNPYDNFNYVTSVHPDFYAQRLHQYTDKLVYIPYFVLQEIDPGNQAAVDKMKHFCFLPGTIFADKVIVQSENMRRIYIEEYIKAAEESGFPYDRRALEEKILGLGSPKLDKVANTRKEDVDIPEDWLPMICREDGSWRTIIFYNTGVTALLQYHEQWLDKIERTFDFFRENQAEVTLLWRPHPLTENTLKSMQPGMQERYRKLKQRYLAEGWGIYDDTPDLNRAIALSDAYYGDGSSIIQLFQKAGKMAMIQQPSL